MAKKKRKFSVKGVAYFQSGKTGCLPRSAQQVMKRKIADFAKNGPCGSCSGDCDCEGRESAECD